MMKTDEKKERLWLNVFCPESSCFRVDEGIDLSPVGKPETEESAGDSEGLFHEIFCPEDSCEVHEYTDLP